MRHLLHNEETPEIGLVCLVSFAHNIISLLLMREALFYNISDALFQDISGVSTEHQHRSSAINAKKK